MASEVSDHQVPVESRLYSRISKPVAMATLATIVQTHTLTFNPLLIEHMSSGLIDAEEVPEARAAIAIVEAQRLHTLSLQTDSAIPLIQAMRVMGEYTYVTAPAPEKEETIRLFNEFSSDQLQREGYGSINSYNEPMCVFSPNEYNPNTPDQGSIEFINRQVEAYLRLHHYNGDIVYPGIGEVLSSLCRSKNNGKIIRAAMFLGAYIGHENQQHVTVVNSLRAFRDALTVMTNAPDVAAFRREFNSLYNIHSKIFAAHYHTSDEASLLTTTGTFPVVEE